MDIFTFLCDQALLIIGTREKKWPTVGFMNPMNTVGNDSGITEDFSASSSLEVIGALHRH